MKYIDENTAIRRLDDHFRVHDDGRATPLLDEAVVAAKRALSNQYWLKGMLRDYLKNPTATKSSNLFDELCRVYLYDSISPIMSYSSSVSDHLMKTIENDPSNKSCKCPCCLAKHHSYVEGRVFCCSNCGQELVQLPYITEIENKIKESNLMKSLFEKAEDNVNN